MSRRPDAGSSRQAASPAVPSRTTAKLVWARPSASVPRCARSVTVADGAVLQRVHTAQLHIRTVRQLQRSAAIAGGQVRQQQGLRRAQSAQRWAHAHDQPIARGHGLPGARAPALDARRGGGHVGFHVENCGGIERANP
ncbi:hypothetical protein MA05_01995 [Comamonas aquatica]|nr:hypothetical protein MA05_01995 [Comamonas aquatica]